MSRCNAIQDFKNACVDNHEGWKKKTREQKSYANLTSAYDDHWKSVLRDDWSMCLGKHRGQVINPNGKARTQV